MVLSLLDMVVIGLSLDGSVTPMPIWHPDGQYLTVMITDESDGPQVYLLDYETGLMEPLVQFTGPGNPLKWLSSTELLYSSDGYYRVWDMAAQESRPFGSDTYPRYGRPLDFQQFLYFTHLSPDYTAITRFYSVRNYNIGVRLGEFDGLTVDEMAELDAIYRTSGFDIHDLNTGITTHVDLDGDFVETLQWSPSGERILVTANDGTFADAGRIYIYDVESGAVEQAGDFPTLEDTEYGPYLPTWSADEQWLAIPSLEVAGYVRYNLTTGETIPLNTGTAIEYMTAFTGVYTRLAWSPVMSYADSPCANFD
jgi:WD40 repeat protein